MMDLCHLQICCSSLDPTARTWPGQNRPVKNGPGKIVPYSITRGLSDFAAKSTPKAD